MSNDQRGRGLPGEPTGRKMIERLIRVDHAGEYGAQQIYKGQLAVLHNSAKRPLIEHMAEQEQVHLQAFERHLVNRQVRPTVLHPLWSVAGFALGAATALMGEKAAMACTIAVEEVIDEHYGQQLDALPAEEKELIADITRFRAEEAEHRDIGIEHHGEEAVGYPVMRQVIQAGSRAAIWLSERI